MKPTEIINNQKTIRIKLLIQLLYTNLNSFYSKQYLEFFRKTTYHVYSDHSCKNSIASVKVQNCEQHILRYSGLLEVVYENFTVFQSFLLKVQPGVLQQF